MAEFAWDAGIVMLLASVIMFIGAAIVAITSNRQARGVPLASLGMSNFRHLFLQSRGGQAPAVQSIRKI
jgi:hypothetical protein